MEKLIRIQKELKAPKGQFNSFGKYKYRSCEDIIESVKPLLDGAILTLSDRVIQIGERYYVEATATLRDGEHEISTVALAREEESKKGMDGSQITGTASSYARKYALNGLLLIDDQKDADTDEHKNHQENPGGNNGSKRGKTEDIPTPPTQENPRGLKNTARRQMYEVLKLKGFQDQQTIDFANWLRTLDEKAQLTEETMRDVVSRIDAYINEYNTYTHGDIPQ